jgi:hypothetical protein
MRDSTAEIVRMMRDVGLADAAVETFCHHYRGLLAGDTGTLDRRTIEPVSDLVDGDPTIWRHIGTRALLRSIRWRSSSSTVVSVRQWGSNAPNR